jgi:hypothetical protein
MTVNRQAARSALGSAWQPVVHHASPDIAVIARPRSGVVAVIARRAAVAAIQTFALSWIASRLRTLAMTKRSWRSISALDQDLPEPARRLARQSSGALRARPGST